MASNNVFEQFNTGVTNNQMSESVDGSQGAISGITNRVLNVDSNLGKSLNEYAGKMFDSNVIDLSKGIAGLACFVKCLVGQRALLEACRPPQAQAAKVMGQTLGVTVGTR